MEPYSQILYLLERYLEGRLTEQEHAELHELLQQYPEDDHWAPYLQKIGLQRTELQERGPEQKDAGLNEQGAGYDEHRWQPMVDAILRRGAEIETPGSRRGALPPGDAIPTSRLARVYSLRRYWWVAAGLLLACCGLYLMRPGHPSRAASFAAQPLVPVNDALPGGNKALLTLADGRQIVLDSVRDGDLTRQNSTRIRKVGGGALVYMAPADETGEPLVYNTLSTPRGGQYTLTLPDGTRVWLNAASSITYPTAFHGGDRQVTVTGEAYLEVVKKVAQPFRVSLPGGLRVEVLGTSFNINAYDDEPSVNSTLIQGAIRVIPAAGVQTAVLLRPGQQAVASQTRAIRVVDNPDVEKVLAWKNGYFQFDNASVEEVLRQISRWYDLDVAYTGKKPDRHYKGKISRNLKASDMLRIIDASGVHFKITGKKIDVN